MKPVSKLKIISSIVITGVMLMSFSGCGEKTYKLKYDGYGFESGKTSYAAGEEVTVYYKMFATDTDYRFFTDSDDVDMKIDFDDGYKMTFIMPEHDVTVIVDKRNTMTADPDAGKPIEETEKEVPDDNGKTDVWFCPECGARNEMKYCSDCGLKRPE